MACSRQTLTNTGTTKINFSYRRCDDSMWEYQTSLSPNESKNIWYIDGTFSVAPLFQNDILVSELIAFPPVPQLCICKSYTVFNNSLLGITNVSFRNCNKTLQKISLFPKTGASICACSGTVTVNGGNTTITDLGLCAIQPSPTPTPTKTKTPTPTPTKTKTPTPTPTHTSTPTQTPDPTIIPTNTPTKTNPTTPTPTSTVTPTNTVTPTETTTPTNTETPTQTPTNTTTPTNTLTPTPTETPCECREYKWQGTQHDMDLATGNTIYNNYAVSMDYDLCQPGCAGPGSGYWRNGGATLGYPFVVTWCQPLTGTTHTPDGPYIYVNDVKTYTGLTSAWSATSTCCSGTTQVLSYGYIFKQSQGVPPAPPYYSGETVFYNNNLVTYDVNVSTGFSLNLIDLWGNNTNDCGTYADISGLTTNGGEIYFNQFGNIIGFSGTSSSFIESATGFSGSNLTIIQSASTTFSTSSSIDVLFNVYPSSFQGTTGSTNFNACSSWSADPMSRITIYYSPNGPITDSVTSLYFDPNLTIPIDNGTSVSDGTNSYQIGLSGLVSNTLICL